MEITEVKIDRGGTLPVRVILADMDGTTFRIYESSKFECQPFRVDVTWVIPYTVDAEPYTVEVRGHRILKSGALGDTHTKTYYRHTEWPAWLQSAVEAARPVACDVRVADDE